MPIRQPGVLMEVPPHLAATVHPNFSATSSMQVPLMAHRVAALPAREVQARATILFAAGLISRRNDWFPSFMEHAG